MKIICVHLFNDFSGSPLVLSTAVRNFVAAGHQVEIVTSRGGEGFLSNIEGVRYRHFSYRFFENKVLRVFALLWSQWVIFFKIMANAKGDTMVYVNTLLPFGAAIAGRLMGKKVVYHLHETTVNPPVLKSFLKKTATVCASEAIYVSRFLQEQEPLPGVQSRVVYNCLSADFVRKAEAHLAANPLKTNPFTVLMLCSMKEYKGVNEFVLLARQLPEFRFVLVLNSSDAAIKAYFQGQILPGNLVIFPSQNDVHSFYREAHLVLNLSHPERWVETFGMTLLEAMSYGLPVIAPPVGGPAELVQDGVNGYKIDQRKLEEVAQRIRDISDQPEVYRELSANAVTFSGSFSEERFGAGINS